MLIFYFVSLVQASRFAAGKYSFTNTCAFDSATNVILVAAFDRPQVRKAVEDLKDNNPIFNLIVDIMTKGLRAYSYQLRAQILLDFHESVRRVKNCHLVDCESNVCPVLARAFINTPSLREISPCAKGCKSVDKSLRTISVNRDHLMRHQDFDNVLHNILSSRGRGYCVKCRAPTDHVITATGLFMIMETDDVGVLMLDQIPKSCCDPLSNGKSRYRLIGIIDFTPPRTATRSVVDNNPELGHYTTISLRPPSSYFKFDDTRANSAPVRLTGNHQARPHALVWFKFDE
ncbi:uncharacterized protein LOC125502156 [Athalia rosae]|uniref:uncharacterized protein LOC125501413 n=1 Tax=Athalia rosae TaxID=37344 RepID=UPI0020345F19|nr:uncharacterized protein LOC125501413 [Athalia rosae]XP_048515907.1 uncharacterized protein LOC125502156 [Athalia rosae]